MLLALSLLLASCRNQGDEHSEHQHSATPAAEVPPAHSGHGAAAAPSGYADFTLDPQQAAAVGLKTATVAEQPFERHLRTTGVVALDETRTSHVHTKVRGWIEKVSADFVGKTVRAGAPLCTLYSQEVYAAELEYLTLLDQVSTRPAVSGAFADTERNASSQLLAAGRRRLQLWDVPEGEITRLEQTREARRTFTLTAPRSGVIVAKQALAGMFVDPSAELYVVSDTSQLWALSDVYEKDVPFVKVGDVAKLRIEGLGAQELETNVAFIPPTVDEATRTLRVRFDLPNKDGRIRPGAFATVEMRLDLGKALAVPETAVIHAGAEDIVFVVHGTHVQPRSVTVGPLVGDRYPVREGLSAGETVAVGAQFLIDSESRLRATSTPGGAHVGH
jgi:membrane fusion protein, copper/silver efflux system